MEYKLDFSAENEDFLEIHTNKRISRGIVHFSYLDSIKDEDATQNKRS